MNMFKEFQQAFIRNLKRLFDHTEGKSSDEVNADLLSEAKNDEERRVFEEILAENKLERELMRECQNSDMSPGEWLEKKVQNTIKEVCPDATQEEIEVVHEAIEQSFVDDVRDAAEALKSDIKIITNDDSVLDGDYNEDGGLEKGQDISGNVDKKELLNDNPIDENVESEGGEEDRI